VHSWPCRGHWLQNKHRCQTGRQHGASAWHPLVHTPPADPTHTTYIRQITHHRTAYTLIRLAFRLAVLVYRCLHGTEPVYLSADLLRVSEVSSRQRLRSATTLALVGRRTQRSTNGDRAFAAAAPAVWNSLPEDARASTTLQLFRRRLKSELFRRCLGPRHSTWLFSL